MPLHLSTTLARTPYALQKQLLKLTDVYANKAHTCLFALSANFPSSQDLADTVDILTKFNKRGHTLGCLSDSFLAVDFSKSNHIWDHEKNNSKPILSCSIGLFDSSRVVPFRSTIPGKTEPQVGRWHSFRKNKDSIGDDENEYELNVRAGTDNGTVSWEDIWNRSALKNVPLPEELRSLDRDTIDSIIYFSDLHPEGLTESLRALPTTTTQLGLVAASTHFISGRPVTLYRDGSFFDDGAVGVALLKEKTNESKIISAHVDFLGIRRLSGSLTVTSREGNMINRLDSSNPTQLLLDAIRLAGIDMLTPTGSFKNNEEFLLGLVSPTGEIYRTYKITAGDPSKRGGSLSLDADMAPLEGSTVQFLHRSFTTPIQLPHSLFHRPSTLGSNLTIQPKQTLAFLSIPEPTFDASQNEPVTDSTTPALVLPQIFLSPSVNGFIQSRFSVSAASSSNPTVVPQDVSQPIENIPDIQQNRLQKSESSWKSSLPGSLSVLEWL